jgi:probable HAF family extracellular repeat protein
VYLVERPVRTWHSRLPGASIGVAMSGSRRRWIDAAALVAAGAAACATAAGAGPTAQAVDLGTLGGSWSFGNAISAGGQVAGTSALPGDAAWHAFSWTRQGGMVDLGTLGGASSWGYGVSADGAVAGGAETASGAEHAFYWSRATGMVDLGASEAQWVTATGEVIGSGPSGYFSWTRQGGMQLIPMSDVRGVTANGVVFGSGPGATGTDAFIWSRPHGGVDLGTLGGFYGSALGVASDGEVVGSSSIADESSNHAFVWSPVTGMRDLGAFDHQHAYALGVNARGDVVVDGLTDDTIHAYFHARAGETIDLGSLSGQNTSATAVNARGQVIGGDGFRAFCWTRSGGLVLPDVLGSATENASGINDAGDVVGTFWTSAGEPHAAVWSCPVP